MGDMHIDCNPILSDIHIGEIHIGKLSCVSDHIGKIRTGSMTSGRHPHVRACNIGEICMRKQSRFKQELARWESFRV